MGGQTARVLVQDPIQEEWVFLFLLGKQHFKNHGVLRKIKKCKYDLLQSDENAQLSLNTYSPLKFDCLTIHEDSITLFFRGQSYPKS